MKKIITGLFVLVLTAGKLNAQSQTVELLAGRMAQKMADSLNLTAQQRNDLYLINLSLNNKKIVVRQQYSRSDSLRLFLQQIESKRDSLYRPVLTESQFLLYKEKKKAIIWSN